jgi:prepilin-type N-terminal cleavage/methylation domain-containing protein
LTTIAGRVLLGLKQGKTGKTTFMRAGRNISSGSAFTLIELLVVIAIVGVLAALLLPVLQRAKGKTQGVGCLNNMKQMTVAWTTYSGENNDKLVSSGGILVQDPNDPAAREGRSKSQWVLGSMAVAPSWTNSLLIQRGLFWPYVKALRTYKCPGDPKTDRSTGNNPHAGGIPTLRSVSMNCWLNPLIPVPGGRIMRKQADITEPAPAKCWVLIDECPWKINDGFFICSPSVNQWIDTPSGWHNGGVDIGGLGSLCFADGHAELHRWRGEREDIPWMQERSTVSVQKVAAK